MVLIALKLSEQLAYKAPPSSPYYWTSVYGAYTRAKTAAEAAQLMVNRTCMLNGYYSCSAPYNFIQLSEGQVQFSYDTKGGATSSPHTRTQFAYRYSNADFVEKYLPIEKVASQVIKNAAAGHAASQAATRETAIEMVIGGQFDQDLLEFMNGILKLIYCFVP